MRRSKSNREIEKKLPRNGKAKGFALTSAGVVKAVDKKLSVVVPVFMEESVLEKNLSFYTDDFKKRFGIELIISDGGSTDKTVEIAHRFADKLVVHEKPEKQTIAAGRNRGAEAADCDTIVFINGDTLPEDPARFYELITEWAEGKGKYSKADALACYVTYLRHEAVLIDKIFYFLHNNYVRFLNAVGMGMGRGECQIVRKSVFRKVGGYKDKIAAGEDFDLYHRINKVGRVEFARDISVCESPRRFRKYGYLRIVLTWFVNSVAVFLFGRSLSKEWKPVR